MSGPDIFQFHVLITCFIFLYLSVSIFNLVTYSPFSSCWTPAETGRGKRKERKGATGAREGEEREGQRKGAWEGAPWPREREGKGEREGQGAWKRPRSWPWTGERPRTGKDEGAREGEGAGEGKESRCQWRSQHIEVSRRPVIPCSVAPFK